MTLLTPTRRAVYYPTNPITTLLNLNRNIERFFESPAQPVDSTTVFEPVAELRENGDRVEVSLDVPGVERGAVSVTIHDGILTISGERKATPVAEGELFRTERSYGRFERQLSLNHPVDSTKISATLKDGILTVTLPKAPEARPKSIDVTAH